MVLPDGSLFGEGVKTRLKEHLMEECNLHTIVRLPNSVFKPYACIGTNLLFFEKGHADQGHLVLRAPRARRPESLFDDQADPGRASPGLRRLVGGNERKGREETPQAWKVTAEEVKARGYNLDIKNPHSGGGRPRRPGDAAGRSCAPPRPRRRALRDQLKAILAEALAR